LLQVTFTPSPEPAHVLLLGAAGAAAAGWLRRRQARRGKEVNGPAAGSRPGA
jgi:hypothetical protein